MLFKKVNEGIRNGWQTSMNVRQNVILIRLLQRVMIQKRMKECSQVPSTKGIISVW